MAPPLRIDTADFTIRAWSVEDTPALETALRLSEAHLRAWTPWVVDGRVPGLSIEERLRRHAADFSAGTEWVYGMFSPSSGEVLGACGLYPRVGPEAVEIGYWLGVTQTGRGLATRATAILTRVAFSDPKIDRVEIHCEAGNVASTRVPQRLGYSAEPITSNLVVWQLTRAQFEARGIDTSADNS